MTALAAMTPAQRWRGRPVEQIFADMPSLHGETFGLVVEDLLAMPRDRVIVVDDFRTLPDELAPILSSPEHAVFLLPTAEFRRAALGDRFSDDARARANWGELDAAVVLERRLARDELWDVEVRRQAEARGLPVIVIDGRTDAAELATELARRFELDPVHEDG